MGRKAWWPLFGIHCHVAMLFITRGYDSNAPCARALEVSGRSA